MWTCPKCERELKNPNQWHNCVKVGIDSLFAGKAEELVYVFDKLLTTVVDWEDVAVSATQNCIVFVHNQTFLVIRPMKKELDIKFYSINPLEDEVLNKTVFYSGKFEHHIRVSKPEDLTPHVLRLLKQSYQFL
jgi:Domain of unknown function (DUF5655)